MIYEYPSIRDMAAGWDGLALASGGFAVAVVACVASPSHSRFHSNFL